MREMKASVFMSRMDKEKVLKQWEKFLKNGLKPEDFTEALYKHLSLHCSFIAHYNRGGFYDMYFNNPAHTQKFLSQFDIRGDCKSIEYGSTRWFEDQDFEDINGEMITIAAKYIPALIVDFGKEEYQQAVDQVKALIRKHKIKVEDLQDPVCCVCGKPSEGKDACDCHCSHCDSKCFDDITLQDHGMCLDCFHTKEEREKVSHPDEE